MSTADRHIATGRIAGAYKELAAEPGRYVSIRRLRELAPDVAPEDFDEVLIAMYRSQEINLVPQSNQQALTPADRAAAVSCGDESKHLMSWRDAGLAPTRQQAEKLLAGQPGLDYRDARDYLMEFGADGIQAGKLAWGRPGTPGQ